MTKQIRATLVAILLFMSFGSYSSFAQQPPTPDPIDPRLDPVRVGFILSAFADESDFVIQMDADGPCILGPRGPGSVSHLYHIRRDNENFKEAVAVALTAVTTHGRVTVKVTGCYPIGSPDPYSPPRNVISRVALGPPNPP